MKHKRGSREWYDAIMGGQRPPPEHISRGIAEIARLGYRESGDAYDWVPVSVAYARYLNQAADPLGRSDFGFAFHLSFPESESCVRKMAGTGKNARGRAGITGPGAERSLDSDEWKTRRKPRGNRT